MARRWRSSSSYWTSFGPNTWTSVSCVLGKCPNCLVLFTWEVCWLEWFHFAAGTWTLVFHSNQATGYSGVIVSFSSCFFLKIFVRFEVNSTVEQEKNICNLENFPWNGKPFPTHLQLCLMLFFQGQVNWSISIGILPAVVLQLVSEMCENSVILCTRLNSQSFGTNQGLGFWPWIFMAKKQDRKIIIQTHQVKW